MKQTNKMRRVLSAALFCASLLVLGSMTSCSKDAVNEETPLTKKGVIGSQDNPYYPGMCPAISPEEGKKKRFFRLQDSKCSFSTINPANQNGMTVEIVMAPGPKKITYHMTRASDNKRLLTDFIETNNSSISKELRIPTPMPYPPGIPNDMILPAEKVIVTIYSSVPTAGGDFGVSFTYFQN